MNLYTITHEYIQPGRLPWLLMASFLVFALCSCQEDWLEEKRDISLAIPTTLEDAQALLHNSNVFQYEPRGFAIALADDYFVIDEALQSLDEVSRNTYTWQYDNLYSDWTYVPDWDDNYQQVFIANVVLETITDMEVGSEEQAAFRNVKGSALFFRARAFFNLAQLFCAPYKEGSTAPGIPLRLAADVEAPVTRSSVVETYTQMIADLERAASLLTAVPEFKLDPSRPAAYAMLARTYLAMRKYELAMAYADSCLQTNDMLLDYNTIDGSIRYPFALFNEEVIMHSTAFPTYPLVSISRGNIDSLLLASYEENDLRRELFVREYSDGRRTFRGAYTGSSSRFGGIATDELFLIRAECRARLGEINAALEDLNALLGKRYKTGTFIPRAAASAADAVTLVLQERRKELLFRGLRWTDLRRLNTEPEHAIVVSRMVEGVEYTLAPLDPRYMLPIPTYVIEQSGIAQNNQP